MSLDLFGLQAGAAQGLLRTGGLQQRACWMCVPRRQYNLGGEKLGTRDRQLTAIDQLE